VSRGLAVGDLDDDGRLDVVINELDGPAQLLRNELAPVGNWLAIELEGRPPNTDAIGSLTTVRAGGAALIRDVRSGTSYLSQCDMRQHFGLGTAAEAESVEVRWPDGSTTRMRNVKANQVVRIKQGAG
jgi:hypothetical protein